MENPDINRIKNYVQSAPKKAKPEMVATCQKAFLPLVDYSLTSEDDDGSFEMSGFQCRGQSDAGSVGSFRRVLRYRNTTLSSDSSILSRMPPSPSCLKNIEHMRCVQNVDRREFIEQDGVQVLNSNVQVPTPNIQTLTTCVVGLSPNIAVLRTREQVLMNRNQILRTNAVASKSKKTRFVNIFRKSFFKKFKSDSGVFRFCGLRKPKSPKIQL